MHLFAYIKWLLFERSYKNMAPSERRRLLDYVLGTDFPFDTFAEFHAHITQSVPAVDVTNPQEAAKYPPATEPARADSGHQEMLRELVHFLLEKSFAFEHGSWRLDFGKAAPDSSRRAATYREAAPDSCRWAATYLAHLLKRRFLGLFKTYPGKSLG